MIYTCKRDFKHPVSSVILRCSFRYSGNPYAFYIHKSSIYFVYKIKLYFCHHVRYAEDIAKVQKQYPSEPFKFLEPRFAAKLCTCSMTFWKKDL